MKPERCGAIAKNGKPCAAVPLPGDTLCAWHSPRWEEKRREWSRKGGAARSNANRAKKQIPEVMSSEELAGWLCVVFKRVVTGQVESGVATAAAAVARAVIAVNEAGAIERLEARIGELEHRAARRLA